MNTIVTLDKAGRVVIPKTLRDELHLEGGDTLELESEGDRMTLRPVRAAASNTVSNWSLVFCIALPHF